MYLNTPSSADEKVYGFPLSFTFASINIGISIEYTAVVKVINGMIIPIPKEMNTIKAIKNINNDLKTFEKLHILSPGCHTVLSFTTVFLL